MERQTNVRNRVSDTVRLMRHNRSDIRITKSQLRDPKVLEMASHGVVKIATGTGEDVVMLPLRALLDLEQVCDLAHSFVQMTVAASQPNVPRALLGDYAFFADLLIEDQKRFLSEFADAVMESIRLGNPKPAAFLVNAYQVAAGQLDATNPLFNGFVSGDVKSALASRLATR
jgi:hypothetical protein